MTDPLRRRGFLSRLAAATSAFGATLALPRPAGAQSQTPQTQQTPTRHELDRWLEDLKGKHKQIFDCVTKGHISEVAYARNFMAANTSEYQLQDSELSVIVSLRHDATPYGYNDAMWEKYKIGESLDVSIGDAKATRNPMFKNANGGDGLIASLAARGVYFTCCGLSTTRYSQEFARKVNGDATAIRAELAANLVPNCRVVPAGVVILNRAQERGFGYIHVG